MTKRYHASSLPTGKELCETDDERLTEFDRIKREFKSGTKYLDDTVNARRESPLPEQHTTRASRPWRGTNAYYYANPSNPYSKTSRSLTVRQASPEEIEALWNSKRDPGRELPSHPPIVNGRLCR